MALFREIRLVRKAGFGRRGARHNQQRWKTCIVADRSAGIAIVVVGGKLCGVLAGFFGATVELQEKPAPRASASIAAIAIRTAASARARRRAAPFFERFIRTSFGHATRCRNERNEHLVCAERMREVTQELPRVAVIAK